jgi:hypothetical protein
MHFMFHQHAPSFSSQGGHDHSLVAEYGEQTVTIIGSMLLIASHLYNLKFKRNCCSSK